MWWGAKIIFEKLSSYLCPQGYRDDFCWLDRLLLKNVYDLAKNFQIFLQKFVPYTILSRKTCDGEQKLLLRIILHINANKGIEKILADWTAFCWKTCTI